MEVTPYTEMDLIMPEKDTPSNTKGIQKLSKSEKKAFKRDLYRQRLRERRPDVRRRHRLRSRNIRKNELEGLSGEELERAKAEQKKAREENIEKMKIHEEEAYQRGQRICINLSFDGIMSQKELGSLAKQLSLSYHSMRRGNVPLKFFFTSFGLDSPLHQYLKKHSFDLWKVHTHSEPYWEIFDEEEVVVLTPDADEDIENFEDGKVYVIGGLVDRIVSSKQSYFQAKRFDLVSKKLPIMSYLSNVASPILNINHVVDIIIDFMENSDWKRALELVVPQRKRQPIGRHGLRKKRNRETRERNEALLNTSMTIHTVSSQRPYKTVMEDDLDGFGADWSLIELFETNLEITPKNDDPLGGTSRNST